MQIIANGLVTGATVALLALAFQLVYLPTKAFHMALAAVYAAVPLLTWQLHLLGCSWLLSAIIGVVAGVLFSIAIDIFNHMRLARRRAGYVAHLLSSLGIYIATVQVIVIIWGNESKALWETHGLFRMPGALLPMSHLLSGLAAIATLILFFVWLRFSNIGLTFRALADNAKEVALRGYNVNTLRLVAFGISGFLGGIAALLEAQQIGFYPYSGLDALVIAITAAIIGGRTSLLGPVIAGFLIGLVRAEVVWITSPQWQDGITFLLLIAFLFARPQGLIARRGRVEAEA
ncbi:MAG TPA: branched-chain amino acid ABC transporter permease [Magnetospirillaceae bacterium]|jgi:branched-chain amino acid transport system permease protein